MNRPLAVLRPQPGWTATADAARAAGIAVIGHPLMTAEPLDWTLPGGRFDGLLAGSGAVFREGGAGLAALAGVPVWAVGEATAAAARAAGFTVAGVGAGGLQRVLDGAPAGRYLRLSGEEHVALTPAPAQRVETIVAYRMAPHPLAADVAERLGSGDAVAALHSAAAARHFSAEADRLILPRGAISLVALGPRIAAAAGGGWAQVAIAERPDDAALLVKAAALCK